MKLKSFAICFFILFAGVNGVFRFTDWLPIYQYGILICSFFIFNTRWRFRLHDKFLFYCFIILIFASFLNWNIKSANYILAYMFVYLFMYKNLDNLSHNLNLNYLMKFNAIGILLSAFFSCIEFFSSFLFNFKISDLLPRYKEATATYMVGIFRSHGFSTEPTTLALYFNILGPFAILYWFNNLSKRKATIYSIILFLGWFFTFSAAAFLFLFLSTLIVFLISYRSKLFKLISRNLIKFISLIIIFLYVLRTGFLNKIIGKVMLSGEGTSSTQRLDVFSIAVERFLNNPLFGLGLGYTSSIDEMSPINWYLIIATNGGLFALFFILAFFVTVFKNSLSVRADFGILPSIGILCALLGFITTSTFFNPFFWIALIFINKMKYNYD